MKKVIGLIPLYDDEKESYWMLPGYMKAIEACGALPLMLPFTTDHEELEQCFSLCDGILLTGGHDVDPAVYHQSKRETCGISCSLRDQMEQFLFEKCLQDDKPVLGICRGIQLMNALLGGTLYQDLPTEYKSGTEHHMTPPYDVPIHMVTIIKGTLLEKIIGGEDYMVNSYHHQAVKKTAPGVQVMAVSEDNLVEAIGIPDKRFAVGVQWHPEFAYLVDERCKKLVQAFVDAC